MLPSSEWQKPRSTGLQDPLDLLTVVADTWSAWQSSEWKLRHLRTRAARALEQPLTCRTNAVRLVSSKCKSG